MIREIDKLKQLKGFSRFFSFLLVWSQYINFKLIKSEYKQQFTLYLANSRVGRGSLVLRHSVPGKCSAEFWRHCVLSSEIQRRALSRYQSKEMKNLIYNFLEWESKSQPVVFIVIELLRQDWPQAQILCMYNVIKFQKFRFLATSSAQHDDIFIIELSFKLHVTTKSYEKSIFIKCNKSVFTFYYLITSRYNMCI